MALPAPTSLASLAPVEPLVEPPADDGHDVANKLAGATPENGTEDLLFQVLSESSADPAERLTTPSGRTVQVQSTGEGDRLTVRAASGFVELEVRFSERGPLLRFSGADVELQATGRLRLEAQTIEAHAREDARITAARNLVLQGDEVNLKAERGDVKVEANDDVKLLGERIRLNT